MTAKQIATHLVATRNVIAPVLRKGLVRQAVPGTRGSTPRLFRICSWRRQQNTAGNLAPLYDLGSKPDMPRPPPLTRDQINAYQRAWRLKKAQ